MSASTEQVARRVASAFPELQPMLEEHLDDNFGEMLPHLFFWDVTQWAEKKAEEQSPQVDELVSLMERLYETRDLDVQNLVVVSFLLDVTLGSALEGKVRNLRERVESDSPHPSD